jgi:hypothetical protein
MMMKKRHVLEEVVVQLRPVESSKDPAQVEVVYG